MAAVTDLNNDAGNFLSYFLLRQQRTLTLGFRLEFLSELVRPGFGLGQLCQPGGLKSGHFRRIDYGAILGEWRRNEGGGFSSGRVTRLSNVSRVAVVLGLWVSYGARWVVRRRSNWNF